MTGARMHVSETLIEQLRQGKRQLRAERRALTLPEKVRQVVQLQEIAVKAAKARRTLTARERVWKL